MEQIIMPKDECEYPMLSRASKNTRKEDMFYPLFYHIEDKIGK